MNINTTTAKKKLISRRSKTTRPAQNREPPPPSAARTSKLMLESGPADCYFIVGENQERIGFIKELVQNTSPIFRTYINAARKGEIHLRNVRPEDIRAFLRFVYTGSIQVENCSGRKSLIDLVKFAVRFKVLSLRKKALEDLWSLGICYDNFCPILECVIIVGTDELLNAVTEYIQNHTHDVFKHRDFLTIKFWPLTLILKQNILSVPEVEVWEAALAWAKHTAGRYNIKMGKPDSIEEVRRQMMGLLKLIRLLTLSLEDIQNHIEPSMLFTNEELEELKAAIVDKTKNIQFINNNRNRRKVDPCMYCVPIHRYEPEINSTHHSSFSMKVTGKGIKLESIWCYAPKSSDYKRDSAMVSLKVSKVGISEDLHLATHTGRVHFGKESAFGRSDFFDKRCYRRDWPFRIDHDIMNTPHPTDVEISPAKLGWPPLLLAPDCEYLFELEFNVYMRGSYNGCIEEIASDGYKCNGHRFHDGVFTCLNIFNDTLYYNLVKRFQYVELSEPLIEEPQEEYPVLHWQCIII